MDTCISTQLELATKDNLDASTLDRRADSSPLRRALRAHFEAYGGLIEPRQELADVALRHEHSSSGNLNGPQRDDL